MNKIGKLNFYDLEIETILGVYDYEKTKKKFYVDLEILFYIGNSYKSDKIEDTISTGMIQKSISEYTSNKNYNLLEKLTYEITGLVLNMEGVISVKTTVYKSVYKNIRKVGYTYKESKNTSE